MLTDTSDDQYRAAWMMHDIARMVRARFDLRARALGVTRQQWRVLVHLKRSPGRTQTELADTLEVERITLCRMIDRLQEAGLVERRADAADRRVWRLHLMPHAQPLVDQLAAIGGEVEGEMLAPLSASERDTLFDLLNRTQDCLRRRGATQDDRDVA